MEHRTRVVAVLLISSLLSSSAEGARPRGSLAVHSDEEIKRITDDLTDTLHSYVHSEQARARFGEILEAIRLPEPLQLYEGSTDRHTSTTCRLCKTLGTAFIRKLRSDVSSDTLYDTIGQICTNANIASEEVCKNMVKTNGFRVFGVVPSSLTGECLYASTASYSYQSIKDPFFSYVAKNTPDLDGLMACGIMIPDCYSGVGPLDWTLDLSFLGRKPRKSVSNLMGRRRKHGSDANIRILQLSDYHWDEKYKAGSNAACKDPTCCRSEIDMETPADNKAGPWGDYRNCDVPWATVDELHSHTVKDQKFDYIYFTGDVIDHGVWETSRETNIRKIKKTMDAIKVAYGDTKVFPILGNHESHPINLFTSNNIADPEISSSWLYEVMADLWTKWLPLDTRATILRGGFYTAIVKEGLRVVALNTMFCYKMNWWLMHEPMDPSGQLMWLADVLLAAEEAGEKVHILEHMPPGNSDCLEAWSREYARIVDRFSDTITAHFYGHTHKDDFRIFYGENGVPNNVAFNGGSLTTFANVNPNYKVYEVDGSSFEVLDSETWGFNITAASSKPHPEWYKIYSFKDAYKVPSLHPVHLEDFVYRLASDTEMQRIFHRYSMLDSDVAVRDGCDKDCAQDLVCRIVTTVSGETENCKKFQLSG